MTDLINYVDFQSEEDKQWLNGLLIIENFDSLYDFLRTVITNWEAIIASDIPSVYQASISFILSIYVVTDKLEELYEKFKTKEAAAYYLRMLTAQSNQPKIEMLLSRFGQDFDSVIEQEETILVSEFCWNTAEAHVYMTALNFTKATDIINVLQDQFSRLEELDGYRNFKIYQNAVFCYTQGILNIRQQDLQAALKFLKQGLEILHSNHIDARYLLGNLQNAIGVSLMNLGSREAMNHFEKSMYYFRTSNIQKGSAYCQANINRVILQEGRFDEALQEAKLYWDTMVEYQEIGCALGLISLAYISSKSLGRIDEAEQYIMKSLELKEKYQVKRPEVLLQAAELYTLKQDFHKAEGFLERYYAYFEDQGKDTAGHLNWLIHKGLIELHKKNLYSAETFLRDAAKLAEKLKVPPLTLQSLVYLIETLIQKYRMEDNQEKRNKLIGELEILAQESIVLLRTYHSIYQMVNYQFVLASVYMLAEKYDLAYDLLKRIYATADENEMLDFIERAKHNMQVVEDLISTKLEYQTESDIKKIKTEFELLLEDFSTKGTIDSTYMRLSYENPNIMNVMIILPSGLPCYSYNFRQEMISEDELLLAALINAIQQFSSEISAQKGVFRTLEHSDYIVLLEQREDYTVVIFTERFTYQLKERMLEFSDIVKDYISELSEETFIQNERASEVLQELDKKVKHYFGPLVEPDEDIISF